jgi:hypothetical protein
MKAMAVAWNRRKNQYFLNKINDAANSIAVTAQASVYTPEADLLRDLLTLGARYRAEYGMGHDSGVLNLALPVWVKDQIIINAVNRGYIPGSSEVQGDIFAYLRTLGFNLFFYEGTATGENQTLAAQAAGAVVALPITAVAYLFAPDSFTVLRGGTLDFGLVRDSSLNHANNLEIMMEEFLGWARTGRKGYKFTFKVQPNGAILGDRDAAAAPALA